MSVPPSLSHACHCINPHCWQPYPQVWGQKTCRTCGANLRLNTRYLPLKRLHTSEHVHVYAAYDRTTGTERILRVLVDPTPARLEAFHREAVVLASLYHRGLPRVEVGGYFKTEVVRPEACILPCLITEKIEGISFQAILEKYPQGCSETWVLDWLKQAVVILEKLHKRRVFHGHLNLSSLVIRRGGGPPQLAIADLGFPAPSHQSESTQPSGGYSPPEQLQGGAMNPTTDFYALGRLCIHLLTGRNPALLDDPVTKQPHWRPKVRVSPALADLLDHLVEPFPHLRPTTAAEILAAIGRIPTKAPPSKLDTHIGEQTQITSSTSAATYSGATTSNYSGITRLAGPSTTGLNNQPRSTSPTRSPSRSHTQVGHQSRHRSTARPIASSGGRSSSSTAPTLMTVGPRRVETYRETKSRASSGTLYALWDGAITQASEVWEQSLHISLVIARIVLIGSLSGSLAAAIGFWITYWSPLTPHIAAFFAYQLASPHMPLVLLPAVVVFSIAGVGTTWGLTLTQQAELDHQLWKQRFMGGLGYGIAWILWQWATPGIPLEQAIARLTSIAALGVVISLGARHNLLTQAIVVVAGTYATFSNLVSFALWQPSFFLNLFPSAQMSPLNDATFWSAVNFFGLLGLVLSFWLGFSYYIGLPLLDRLGRLWR
jgi:serine/threonine protein kinase